MALKKCHSSEKSHSNETNLTTSKKILTACKKYLQQAKSSDDSKNIFTAVKNLSQKISFHDNRQNVITAVVNNIMTCLHI